MRALSPSLVVLLAVVLGAVTAFGRGDTVRVGALFSHGARPVRVGRLPPGVGDGTSAACASCHAEIAREWRESQHASAWRDEVFQAAYDVEPMQFCRSCHAPLAPAGRHPDARAAEEGVSCTVCHVRDGHVLGPGRSAPTAGAHTSDPMVAMRTSAFCEGCHQFNFRGDSGPRGEVYATDEPMQDTHAEWAMSASAARGEHCQACHMPTVTSPDGRTHRSHRFPGGGDRALLSSAVRVEASARREGGVTVARVAVHPERIGHSFPTGDLFRRAELRVWIDGDEAHAQTVAMAREFRPVLERDPHGRPVFVRREARDTRVAPPGVGVVTPTELRFTAPAATRLRWRLDHLLMPTPLAASQGFGDPRVRTTIAEGLVDLPGAPP
jgi:hypothetical protein